MCRQSAVEFGWQSMAVHDFTEVHVAQETYTPHHPPPRGKRSRRISEGDQQRGEVDEQAEEEAAEAEKL